jgi:hypothetical protein
MPNCAENSAKQIEEPAMSKSIHLVCERGLDGWPRNVTSDPVTKMFRSGFWDMAASDAETVVGGWIYFHETKKSKSYMGGRVHGVEPTVAPGLAHPDRIVFAFRPAREAKMCAWRGQGHGRAWTGGPVDAALPHERTAHEAA